MIYISDVSAQMANQLSAVNQLPPVNHLSQLSPDSLLDTSQTAKAHPSSTVAAWTVDDVCHWLSSMGLSKHAPAFRANDIDGYELLQLNKDVMEKELRIGMSGMGHTHLKTGQ